MGRERNTHRSNGMVLVAAIMGILFPCSCSLLDEVNALLSVRHSIYDDSLSPLLNWNAPDENPCSWSGVACSPDHGSVISLILPNASLRGFLAPEIGLLTSLQTLNLSGNSILGTIPKSIGKLSHLIVLDLSNNQLSGPIPSEVGNLTSSTKIYLQHNQLTGNLPPEIGNLKSLVELKLNANKLQGPLPGSYERMNITPMQGRYNAPSNAIGLCRSTKLKVADFSDNYFTGRVPACLNYLPRSSFRRNCLLGRESAIQHSSQQCVSPGYLKGQFGSIKRKDTAKTKRSSSHPTWLLAVEIATGVVACSLLLYVGGAVFFRCHDKQKVKVSWKQTSSGLNVKEIEADYEALKGITKISRQDLELACEEFSNVIGSSPDSVVYKGTLKGGPEIAVISLCISEDYWTSYLNLYFQTEVSDLARLNHANTAKLIGYCSENYPFSRMLVFEYASNGTLYEHLHYGEEDCQLSWPKRMKIVIGIARGLRYMHCELQPAFVLTELNSSAVYLTEDFTPKLVDFESWKAILSRSEKNSGNVNYPGYSTDLSGRFSSDVKGNIFEFGVLLLEIVSGRPPYCKEKGFLVDWAKEYLQIPEVIPQLVDPQLKYYRHEDVQLICDVVSLSIQPESEKRPSMTVLCAMLEGGIDMSPTANLKETPLAWAELVLSSDQEAIQPGTVSVPSQHL